VGGGSSYGASAGLCVRPAHPRHLRQLLAGLEQAVAHWFTDAWWAYVDELDPATRTEGKAALQRLERKHLTLRTRLKRLARKLSASPKSSSFTTASSPSLLFTSSFSVLHAHYTTGFW